MAKTAGNIRASKWDGDIYHENGVRKEYGGLSDGRKMAVRALYKELSGQMYDRLKEVSVPLDAGGLNINVQFTRKGIEHVARDAMLTLSGKYMSRKSMLNIDQILAKSKYVSIDHAIYKDRKDGKELFFRYIDSEGRGLYFKVSYERAQGNKKYYSLYSVTDK